MGLGRKIWSKLQEVAEEAHNARVEKGCEYCRSHPICNECYRCSSWNCNAGCIFCVGQRPDRWKI